MDEINKAQIKIKKALQLIGWACGACKSCEESNCKGYRVKKLLVRAIKLFPRKESKKIEEG